MSKQISPPRGMRDILPADKAKRDYVLDTIIASYKRHGFTPIETPAVEKIERLKSNQGGENETILFHILRRGLDEDAPIKPLDAVDLGLRYDLTLPLTRFYSTHQAELPAVFRSLQTGPVWRAERPQKGRYRQFTQCDIDIIGDGTWAAEVDLLIATLSTFEALGMKDKVRLLINDRRTLTDMLGAAGIDQGASTRVFITLDKLHKIGRDNVVAELADNGLCTAEQAHSLLDALESVRREGGSAQDPLVTGTFAVGEDSVSLYDIPQIAAAVKAVTQDIEIVFDPTLVRGMGYYTGTIFEVEHVDFSSSVAGGGRYDGVVGKWLGRDVPACGFSIGFERIIDLIETYEDDGQQRIAVTYPKNADIADVMAQRARLLEDESISAVGIVPQPKKVKATFLDSLLHQGYTHIVRQDFDGNWQEPKELKQ